MPESNTPEPWAEAGIPGHVRIRQMLYNRPSSTLIVTVQKVLREGPRVNRLFFRSIVGAPYRPIEEQDGFESQDDVVSCESSPLLLFNEMRVRPPEPDSLGFGVDWISVRRFNLLTSINEVVLDSQSLRPPSPYVSTWVASIVSAWPDGTGAVCKVGFQRPKADNNIKVEYFICDISFNEGITQQIASLPWIFL